MKSKFIQKDMTGTLFLNTEKTETRHPDYKGRAVIKGKTMYLSAWIKMGKSGHKFISLAITEPLPKPPQKQEETYETPAETYDEGDGEPDLNQKIDEFSNQVGSKNVDEDVEVPF